MTKTVIPLCVPSIITFRNLGHDSFRLQSLADIFSDYRQIIMYFDFQDYFSYPLIKRSWN